MLVAVNEAEQIINLLEFSKSDLTELVGQFLRCPACKSQVRLKNGHVKMPHFAHVNLAACQYYSENESLQHLTLKNVYITGSSKQSRSKSSIFYLSYSRRLTYWLMKRLRLKFNAVTCLFRDCVSGQKPIELMATPSSGSWERIYGWVSI